MTAPSVATIQARVAAHFNLPRRDMTSPVRVRAVARPRQIAMYLARELTDQTWPQLGRRFKRDHTTVRYGVKVVALRREQNFVLDQEIAALAAELSAAGAE